MSELVEVLPLSTVVEIKVNGAFLTRVQALLVHVLKDLSKEEITAGSEKIKTQTHNEPWEFHYETLAILINDIERTAKEQKLTEMKSVEEMQKDAENMVNPTAEETATENLD
jgi:thioester reductase-like protein